MNDLNKELIARGTAAAAVGIANSRGIKVRLGRQNDYPLAVTSGEERREIVTLKGKSGRVCDELSDVEEHSFDSYKRHERHD